MTLDYYFTSISPFTYLGHQALMNLASLSQTEVQFRPVQLGKVFAHSGATPLPQRTPSRQAYRLLELERWARKRSLVINLQPAFFPTDPGLADRCVIALQHSGQAAGSFLQRVLAACWAEEKDIADAEVLREILAELELDAEALLTAARSTPVQQEYDANTEAAISCGVLGAPAYLLNGEQFWGQDRLELLAEALERQSSSN